jgi:amino acid transporter
VSLSAPPVSGGGVAFALAKSRIGVFYSICFGIGAAAPLTVIAGGATAGFAITAIVGIALAYVLVAFVLGLFSNGYIAMSRRIINAGAFYAYVTHGLGRVIGVAAAFIALPAYGAMQVGLYGGFGTVMTSVAVDGLHMRWPWWMWSGAALLVVGVVAALSITVGGRLLSVLLAAEVIVALVLAGVHLAHPADGSLTLEGLTPSSLGNVPDAVVAMVVAIAGFVGFEITAALGEEARDPQRTVARATALSVLIIGVLYAFCAWAMTQAAGPGHIVERATAEGPELIFALAAPYVPNALIILGHLLFTTSLFAAILSFHNVGARYVFALGREGVLPRVFGLRSARTDAPWTGSLLQSAIGFAGIALYAIAGWDPYTQMFFWLTVLGGVGVLILMTLTSLAVLVFFSRRANRHHAGLWRGRISPALSFGLLGAILLVTLAKFDVLTGVAPDSPLVWILPGLFALGALIGLARGVYLLARRPEVWARIGRGADRTLVA